MSKLSRRQVIAMAIAITWAILLAVGLTGSTVSVVPQVVTSAAGVIAVLSIMFIIPGGVLYGMLQKDRVAREWTEAHITRTGPS